VNVGVLAVQGDFAAHARALARAGHEAALVRRPRDFEPLDALVLPGGESTAILRGIARDVLDPPLRAFLTSGRPVLGTCAGAILLARRVTHPAQPSYAVLDIDVTRNAYGTQLDSFATTVDAGSKLDGLEAVCIRAPRIERIGAGVEVLAYVRRTPVLVREGSIWAATFHPELTDDARVLQCWLGSSGSCNESPGAVSPSNGHG